MQMPTSKKKDADANKEKDADANIVEAEFDFVNQKNISSDPTQITRTQPIEKNKGISVAPPQ